MANTSPSKPDLLSQATPPRIAAWLVLLVLFGWSYGLTLSNLVHRWWSEPDYIYCFLVPPFAAFLLWLRREMMPEQFSGSLWGIAFLVGAGALRLLGAYGQMPLLDAESMVVCVAGVVVLMGGWPALLWAWPGVVFLIFMVPLPSFMASMLSEPLQAIGAVTSTYILQTLGIAATARGNIISLPHADLGVQEACSGLRMLMLFVAVGTGAALITPRPAWERIVLILSSAPIAVIANVTRISVTGVLYETAGPEWGDLVFHDLAGYFMMPLAVILLWMEMGLMSMLFRAAPDEAFDEWL